MNKWQIDYWDGSREKGPVEAWFDELTKDELKEVAKKLKMLEIAGNELKMPHSKPLGKGLFELRELKYGFRLYYGFRNQQIIIVLAAGHKKKQQSDIRIARERLSKLE